MIIATSAALVKYKSSISKTLRAYFDRIGDKIHEVDSSVGYGTESEFANDVLLTPGWCAGEIGSHTVIEETVADTIAKLRGIRACDCGDCQVAIEEHIENGAEGVARW